MKDKQTETKLRLISLQVESWKKLHDLITYGLDKAKPIISVEQERQFTEVRANLLQETEHVLRELNLLSDLSGRAMNVLNRGSSLRAVRELSNDDARRLEVEWNGVFTKLGVAQGQLKSRRKAFAELTPFTCSNAKFGPIFPAILGGEKKAAIFRLRPRKFKRQRDLFVVYCGILRYGEVNQKGHCGGDQQPDRHGPAPGFRCRPAHAGSHYG